jgi:hypothetical protein
VAEEAVLPNHCLVVVHQLLLLHQEEGLLRKGSSYLQLTELPIVEQLEEVRPADGLADHEGGAFVFELGRDESGEEGIEAGILLSLL